MNPLLIAMFPISFIFFPNGDLIGTTTEGVPFSQTTVVETPRIQEFKIEDTHWYICDGGVMYSLQDWSICLSNQYE